MPNGRRKGCVNERAVAALLADWWQRLEPGCSFVRTPSSGGWSSANVRAEFRASGDVMTTAAYFPFCVEAKRREAFCWERFLAGKASPVWSWWEQTCRAADEQTAVPMLWMRKNGERWRVVLPAPVLEPLVARRVVPGRFVLAHAIPVPPVTLAGVLGGLPGQWRAVAVVGAAALLAVEPALLVNTLTEVLKT